MQPTVFEIWTTIGTVGAVVVALLVALVQATVAIALAINRRSRARRKVASLVSAWIEHEYKPSNEGSYYRRTVTLHIANESDEPVFDIQVVNGIEAPDSTIRLGPLSAPRIIPVLPPKREFVYDVTTGMLGFGNLAHDAFNQFVAELTFRDHEEVQWERDFAGNLKKMKTDEFHNQSRIAEAQDDVFYAQAGPIDNPYNPLGVVFLYANAASDDHISNTKFRKFLVEHAIGWKKLSDEDLQAVRKTLRSSSLALHVWYSTPRIAYVRLINDPDDEQHNLDATVLTLVWRNGKGWRFFGIGPFLPWDIGFAKGELDSDPLDGRE